MRGTNTPPQFSPAFGYETRTQHEAFSSPVFSLSQCMRTFTRFNWSVKTSSPDGPTTVAVWVGMTGLRWSKGLRNGTVRRCASTMVMKKPVLPSAALIFAVWSAGSKLARTESTFAFRLCGKSTAPRETGRLFSMTHCIASTANCRSWTLPPS
ncbi:hypothetical protein AWB64_04594 [Caballeronia sordidicola]|uniref:Uncharacterized protein n=1 Tax=Caballeronia sordidicola TaxID=196367 RepID=A0A158HGB1_CABSO|nr:hypothetical protein AWB64_04594 [Caballeronia sordidicola]